MLKGIKRNYLFEEDNVPPFEYKKLLLFTNWNSIFSLNEKFKEEILFTNGDSTINEFMLIDKNHFFVSNSNRTIIIFSLR